MLNRMSEMSLRSTLGSARTLKSSTAARDAGCKGCTSVYIFSDGAKVFFLPQNEYLVLQLLKPFFFFLEEALL